VRDAVSVDVGTGSVGYSATRRGTSNWTATAFITMIKMIQSVYLIKTEDLYISTASDHHPSQFTTEDGS
jgi:hypothetical protein